MVQEVRGLGRWRKAALAAALLLGAKCAAALGAGAALTGWIDELAESGRMVTASLSLELGRAPDAAETPGEPVIYASPGAESPGEAAEGASPSPEPSPEAEPGAQYDENGAEIIPTTITGGLTVKNSTGYNIDVGALLAEGPALTLPAEGPQVLIVHTHGSEAYTPTRADKYEESDAGRTEDKSFNVIRVGDELAEALTERGVSVVHDREIYDYPSYTGSYNRSGAAVEAYLTEYPDIAVVIDLHRDALGDGEVVYKTVAELDGAASSQLMMLVGTGESGLYHPNWEQNLRLALYLQQAVNERFPTLARPISLVKERYNQHLSTGMFILEVGSSGNSLQEALTAVRLYAEAVAPALLRLAG